MTYSLGVDLGTTYTAAAIRHQSGHGSGRRSCGRLLSDYRQAIAADLVGPSEMALV